MNKLILRVSPITLTHVLFYLNAIAQVQSPVQPPDYPAGTLINFVRTWDAQRPLTDDNMVSLSTNLQEVTQTTQYLDGLGRPIQTVTRATSPLGKDMVAPIVYDQFGREQYKFLPYASSTGTDGNFKLTPFADQKNFYNDANANSPILGQGETYYYSQNIYESSPLSRINETQAPGNSWVGSSRGVKKQYLINTDIDDVKIWTITESNTPGGFASYSVLSTNPTYAAGQLYKTITIDEAGNQVIEFKDKEAKVILKKVQHTATGDNGTGANYIGWLSTYYIYDDLDNLRCVMQPEGVSTTSSDWVIKSDILDEQCFRYEYDARNRMIMKKVPGAAPVTMIYDARDRLVMTQDGNMATGTSPNNVKKWLITSYDALNRPIITGLLTDANTPAYHQTNASLSTTYPDISGSNFELLTQTYFDDYTWFSASGSPFTSATITTSETSSGFLTPTNTVFPYPQANNTGQISNVSLVTGNKVKVLGSPNTYLYSVTFYDDQDRPIQTRSTNITGGTDKSTNQYSFDGKVLVNKVTSSYNLGTTQQHILVTKNTYTSAGRVISIQKNIDNTGSKITVSNNYDELGQLGTKTLGPVSGNQAANLTYDYNIRGWILGLNRSYVLTTNVPSSRKFGYQIGYDKTATTAGVSFTSPQYNGNIAGVLWKSSGDGIRRKYDYSYDPVNRLMKADFVQNNNGTTTWDHSMVDYTVKMGADGVDLISAYTWNGNIRRMQQWGLEVSGSTKIDDLYYDYFILNSYTTSNKIKAVTELGGPADHKLGDFTDKNTVGADYGYDLNGNLITDLNKKIVGSTGLDLTSGGAITYNYLNLPQQISAKQDDGTTLKGTITYTYDAIGNKIKKVTIDVGAPNKTITTATTYLGPLVYETKSTVPADVNDYTDVLQFVGHEEGRIRFKPADNTVTPAIPASYPFDYFIKDHLGNVRMVLTDETQTDVYPAATLENSKLPTEQSYYDINTAQIVDKSLVTGLPAYQNNNTIPNPPVNATFDNANSAKLYKLNKNSQKMGLGLTLKVMAGDKFDIYGKSYYFTNNSGGTGVNSPVNTLDILTGMLGGPSGSASTAIHGLVSPSQLNASPLGISSITSLLSNQTTTNNSTPTVPKAFINYVLFDEQFKCVSSGFAPVGANGVLTDYAAVSALHNIPVLKNGFVYIYCSNESPVDVFFDNIQVVHTRGPILEETHYYPFGLTMAGISSKAAGKLENKYKYNGKELQAKEFSDGSGLELYDFGAREQDPQIGRWWSIDPLAHKRDWLTPYNFVQNNPLLRIDPNGLTDYTLNNKTGDVKQVGEKNDDPDRILKTNRKGEVKYKKNGEAKIAVDGIEQGILKDGINFQKNDNVFAVGGKGQPSVNGVKSFTLQLSEYIGKEIKGFSYSADGSKNVTDMVLGKYISNEFDKSYGSPQELIRKFGVNYSSNNVLQEFHTHPKGELGATQSAPELSADVRGLQSDKPQIPNASFIILYRIAGQVQPAEYDYTHEYIPKKD